VRILVDHGLLTISLLANLVAIFLGANFLYKELELRTLYVLLARPVGATRSCSGSTSASC
jgi:ABC-type transport system involved in multi-copper enzyme maturation permease subunit